VKILSLQDVEQLAYALAKKTMNWNEPIPKFNTRFPGRLESCLKTPFQTFGGKDVYPTLLIKASQLFYLMIKNYPFQNGNKRIAVTSLLVFLFINTKWIKIDPDELYQLAVFVAGSPPTMREGVIIGIKTVLNKNVVNRK
jgi:death on curing protein